MAAAVAIAGLAAAVIVPMASAVPASADSLLYYSCSGSGLYYGCASPTANLNVRSGPGTSYSILGSISSGSGPYGLCQVLGSDVNGNYIWDIIGIDGDTEGNLFVSDYYMNTTSYGTTMEYPCSY